MKINNVVVIGSGTMGSGIAAHLCNANVPVTLLDLTTEISQKAKERIGKSRPPLLIDKSKLDNIHVGNIEENFDVVSNADWIVEAVVERIDIKHNIYEKIFKHRKKESVVSSNTSSIPISVLSEKLSDQDKKDFCITHFFNFHIFCLISIYLFIPLILSDLLLRSSAVTSISVERTIKQVATARIVAVSYTHLTLPTILRV